MEPTTESFDTEYQNDAVCPYCGYRHQDTWEFFCDDENLQREVDCQSCGKTFLLVRHVSVEYTTCVLKEKS